MQAQVLRFRTHPKNTYVLILKLVSKLGMAGKLMRAFLFNGYVGGVVGLKFYDIKISKKKKYTDTYKSSKGLLSGNEWYCQQTFRALNQAAVMILKYPKRRNTTIHINLLKAFLVATNGTVSKLSEHLIRQQVSEGIDFSYENARPV
ncbi:hypothetical protein OROHE_001752 [Orobanche hederae]